MTTLTFGRRPRTITLELTEGSDLVATIRAKDGSTFSPAAVITVNVADQEWTATVDGDTLRWHVDKADVAAVIADDPSSWKLTYTEGATDLVWATGPVAVTRA